jgi:hypothetical protein
MKLALLVLVCVFAALPGLAQNTGLPNDAPPLPSNLYTTPSYIGTSGSGLPAGGGTTPANRAQVVTETPNGTTQGTGAWALPGDSPTDRGSGEASYTIAVTDIGTSIRETNVNGEAFTIPDGNTNGFVLPVNIGFIIEGGTSTITRTTSSQFRCTPNGPLANTCTLNPGAQYILKETSDFNYTLSVAGDTNPSPQDDKIWSYSTEFGTVAFSTNLYGFSAPWQCSGGTNGTVAISNGSWPYFAYLQMTSSATASSFAQCAFPQVSTNANPHALYGSNTGWDFTWVAALAQTTNTRAYFGLFSANAAVRPTDGMWIRYDTNATFNDTKFTFETCKASACTIIAQLNVDTNFHRFEIKSTVVGTIDFFIDNANHGCFNSGGTGGCTASANIPTVAELPTVVAGNDTTASASLVNFNRAAGTITGLARP